MSNVSAINSKLSTNEGIDTDFPNYFPRQRFDITELCILVFAHSSKHRELNHTLSKLYSERQFQEQTGSASYPRSAATTTIVLSILSATASVFGAVIGGNADAANRIGQGLYNRAPSLAHSIYGNAFNQANFSSITQKAAQTFADLLTSGSKITEHLTQSFKAHADAETTKTQQMYQMAAEDERTCRESQGRVASDLAKWQEAEHNSSRAILGR